MRTKLILAAVVSAILTLGILFAQQTPKQIRISWTYPADMTGVSFYVSESTNLTTPMLNWPIVASVFQGSNVTLNIVPGAYFFTVRASNFWGYSDFSNVALTPAAPIPVLDLNIFKLP